MYSPEYSPLPAKEYVAGLIERSRAAQKVIAEYTQEQVDLLCEAMAYEITREENVQRLGKLAVEESKLGNYESKCGKLRKKIRGVWRDIQHVQSMGIIETDTEKGIVKFVKPVGVIGGIVPCTNPRPLRSSSPSTPSRPATPSSSARIRVRSRPTMRSASASAAF